MRRFGFVRWIGWGARAAVAMSLLLCFLQGIGTARAQSGARALYVETSRGAAGWQYDYTLYNDLSPSVFAGFTLYDVTFILPGSASATVELRPTGWTDFTMADFIEVFAVNPGAPPLGAEIAPGASLAGFRFRTSQRVGSLDFVASFTDPNDPDNPRIYVGASAPAAVVSPNAPEPGTAVLALIGVLILKLTLCPVSARSRRRLVSKGERMSR